MNRLSRIGDAPVQPDERVVRCEHPPSQTTVLFDGHCRFCVRSAAMLARLGKGRLKLESFREDGVLERFAPLGLAQCERAMQCISTDGRITEGAAAIVESMRGRWFGPLARAYYLPGIRQAADAIYAVIARHRFRLAGRACDDGTCRLH